MLVLSNKIGTGEDQFRILEDKVQEISKNLKLRDNEIKSMRKK